MKIIVTGGAGFIGSQIVDAYIDRGHQVLILDNFSSGKEDNVNPQAQVEKIDLADERLSEVIKAFQPEIINHHAAQIDVRASVQDPSYDARVNIIGSLQVLQAAKDAGSVRKVLFASSGGAVYGDAEHIPTTEKDEVKPISPYGVSKLSTEHYLYYYKAVYGMDYVALRYANVYGPRQNPHGEAGVVAIFYQRILTGQPFVINGEGNQTRDFVFVKDVVAANMKATEANFVGSINVATTQETSINRLVEIMSQAVGHTQEIPHGPGKEGEQLRSCLSYELAQKELDWQPQVSIEDGLHETAEFFKSRVT